MEKYKFWFITGSQYLYGQETLDHVAEDSRAIVTALNNCGRLPCPLVGMGVMKTSDEITEVVRQANADASCAGIIVFMHTFSPSKMWISGLSLLQKPYLHFHTQFNEEIPNEAIDMDYMNLHQSAHGDREHGFIVARMRISRKVIAGYWKDEQVQDRIGNWMRAAVGAVFSRSLKVIRFGDNMREVAVTEGDKVEAQIKFGWEVNTWPVGSLAEEITQVTEAEIDDKVAEYKKLYNMSAKDMAVIRYQAREEIAIEKMMTERGAGAFVNNFQDLYGMEQLPGLASQDLMRKGYGYGAEGDWKVSAMTAIVKRMAFGRSGGTAFMEDYTYDFKHGLSLGAHMLEVCPSVAAEKPRVEVHPLGIGDRNPPARLVFEGHPGKAIVISLIDMGGRFRLIVQDIECIKPIQTMPNLPVARVMWRAAPDLTTGAECWLLAGGAHHTVLTYDCDAEILADWANMMDIEFVHIDKDTTPESLKRKLFLNDLAWKLKN